MRTLLLTVLLLVTGPVAAQAPGGPTAAPATTAATPQAGTAATHQALRALRDRLVAAVNEKDEAALLADLDSDVVFTAMNNEIVRGADQARSYYAKMLVGSQRIVEDMSLTAQPDDLSILLADGNVAIATGTSNAHFDMMAGQSFDVPLRWTATLDNSTGAWKVAAIHFSANMFDNPLMSAAMRFVYPIVGGVALIGLLVGWLLGRRRKRA